MNNIIDDDYYNNESATVNEAIRDPVLGWIKFSDKEKKIINCNVFQRLRFVLQLTATQSIYPGGTHNRFIHSLGVMTIAGKYMKHLLSAVPMLQHWRPHQQIDETRWVQIARIAGLLHDIGHGPFSHSFDRIVYSKVYHVQDGGHDVHRLKLIRQSPLKECIEECGVTIDDIEKAWEIHPINSTSSIDNVMYYIVQLAVGGPLGADRIDFILRDSYFTGTNHLGTIAWKRIVYNSMILIRNDFPVLTYAMKTLQDIIQALDGRRYMYHGVYLHPKVEAASIAVEKMMESLDVDDLLLATQSSDQFALLNDYTIIGKSMCLDKYHPARQWCERYMNRELPVLVKELIVDGTIEFDEQHYRDLWFNEQNVNCDNICIRNTRRFTGIDPIKFKQYNIYFYQKGDNGALSTIDCTTALKNAHFKTIKPYYVVRAFHHRPLTQDVREL